MSNQNLHEIELDKIIPSKDNARKIDQNSECFRELVNSIKAGGVRVLIHVRQHPDKKGKYEIRAGERRWRACKSLGMKTIPAILHDDMDDETALDLTYIENKFREDLKPLEEVAEIGRCMNKLGDNAKIIAERLGQTEQWVRLRANIHKNLHQDWRKEFMNLDRNRIFQLWTVAHLTLVARLPANIQKDLLEEIRQYSWQRERTISVKDLEERIAGELKLLSKAKWTLDDETLLPKAGACTKCNKRSGYQPLLWFGESMNDQIKSKDRCLDSFCWKDKLQAYLKRRAKEAAEKYPDLIYIANGATSGWEDENLSKTFGRVLGEYNVDKSTKSAKGSVPALIVHGKGIGNITYVKERQISRPGGARRTGKPTPLKERKQLLDCKRWAQVLKELQEKLGETTVEQIKYKDKITGVMALTAIYGNKPLWHAMDKVNQKEIKEIIKKAEHGGRKKVLEYLWESVKPTLDNILNYVGPVTQTPKRIIEEAKWIAELIRFDIQKVFDEVSQQKGFTIPKSWNNLNLDGTPKAKKTKKKKVT